MQKCQLQDDRDAVVYRMVNMLLAICMLFIVFTVLIKETEERVTEHPFFTV
jgi:hypothetical protein